MNEEVGRLKAKVEEMKADDDVATDSDMTESLTTVSDFLNSLKDEPIDENSLRRILKVQALVQEADNKNDNQD